MKNSKGVNNDNCDNNNSDKTEKYHPKEVVKKQKYKEYIIPYLLSHEISVKDPVRDCRKKKEKKTKANLKI